MDNEMLTKVNYGIMKAFFDREPDESGNRVFTVSPVDNEDLAIAAIKAMRDPTKKMIEAGFDNTNAVSSKIVYQAMIDAVIGE